MDKGGAKAEGGTPAPRGVPELRLFEWVQCTSPGTGGELIGMCVMCVLCKVSSSSGISKRAPSRRGLLSD